MPGQPSHKAFGSLGASGSSHTPPHCSHLLARFCKFHSARRSLTIQRSTGSLMCDLTASAQAQVQHFLHNRFVVAMHLGSGAGSVGASDGGIGQSLVDAVAGNLSRSRGARER